MLRIAGDETLPIACHDMFLTFYQALQRCEEHKTDQCFKYTDPFLQNYAYG